MVGRGEVRTRTTSVKKDEKKEKIEAEKPKKSYRKSPSRQEVKKTPPKAEVKSPGRAKGRPKSPGRTPDRNPAKKEKSQSPARSRATPRSPSRRDEVKKSPPKKILSVVMPTRLRTSNLQKNDSERVMTYKDTIELDSDSDTHSELSTASKMSSIKTRLRRTPNKEGSVEVVNNAHKRSSRLREYDRVVHLKSNYEPISKLSEFSDEDDFELNRKSDNKVTLSKGATMNAVGAAIHMLAIFLTLFAIYTVCNDKLCSFQKFDLNIYKHFYTYLDLTVFLSYIAFILLITILSVIPFGGKKITGIPTKYGKLNYVMNGLFTSAIVMSIVIALELYNLRVCDFIINNLYKFIFSAFIFALPLAILIYVKSLFVPIVHLNVDTLQNRSFYNFFYGSETNPRFFDVLDLKIVLFRTSFIALLVVLSSVIHRSLHVDVQASNIETIADTPMNYLQGITFNATTILLSLLMVVYILDAFVFEHMFISSAEIQYETFGYLKCIEYTSFIGLYTLIPKYALESKTELPLWQLIATTIIFFIGYVLYRGSSSQKYAFRMNPYSPSVAHLESIPTSIGKKLICSGYWGLVRHPNYLGDILINLSFAPFVLSGPPVIIILLTILGLIERAHKDNKKCRERYGASWERYCQRVKYILIPKVF